MLDRLVQKRFFRYKRRFKFLPGGMMSVLTQSAFQQCDWIASLAHVNPEYRQVRVTSNFWFCVFFGSLFGMALVLLTHFLNHNESITQLDFLENFLLYFVGSVIGLPCYLYSKQEYTVFHYEYDGEPVAFGLYRDNPDPTSHHQFVNEICDRIKQARIEGKEREITKAMEAVDYLTKEQVISETASTILHYRIDDMNYFSND